MSNKVHWTLEWTVNEGKLEELKTVLGDIIAHVGANEPGTIIYEHHLTPDDKKLFSYEAFSDAAGAMAHLQSTGPKLGPLMGCVTPVEVRAFGEVPEDLRAALADFKPTYMNKLGTFVR
jgi:quinol monooxygenase YgiN